MLEIYNEVVSYIYIFFTSILKLLVILAIWLVPVGVTCSGIAQLFALSDALPKNVPAGRENKEHYREILKELHLILYYKGKSMQKDISIIV